MKQAEGQTHQFIKTLGLVETKLSDQINYLTQVSTGEKNQDIYQFCSKKFVLFSKSNNFNLTIQIFFTILLTSELNS